MESTERKVAKALLDIKAVMLSPDKPFKWASGWLSPIYCDNRKATGAIAHGALIAYMLKKPFVYVRPKPKDHGTGSQIEGMLPEGAKVVVVEDLISTGASSLSAVDALVKAGAYVKGMVAIFSYNFNQSRRAFENADVELNTLTNYDTLIDVASQTGYINASDMGLLKEWRFSPSTWGKNE